VDAGISHSGNVVKASITQGFYPACDHGTCNSGKAAHALGYTDNVQAKWLANGNRLAGIVRNLWEINSQACSRHYGLFL